VQFWCLFLNKEEDGWNSGESLMPTHDNSPVTRFAECLLLSKLGGNWRSMQSLIDRCNLL